MNGNDDFFGGSIPAKTSSAAAPRGLVPRGASSQAAQRRSFRLIGSALVVITLLAVGYFGIRELFLPKIALPDTLMGLERIDPQSDFGRGLEKAFNDTELAQLGLKFEVAGYGAADRMLVVAVTDDDEGVDPEDFFRDTVQVLTDVPSRELAAVDPGSGGGQLRCLSLTAPSSVNCAWMSERSLGVVVMFGSHDEASMTAIEIRDIVEK